MRGSLTCSDNRVGQLLHAYELHQLDDAQRTMFEQHLLECNHCFQEVSAFTAEAAQLRHSTELAELVAGASSHSRRFDFRLLIAGVVIALLLVPAYMGISSFASDTFRPVQVIALQQERTGTGSAVFSADRDGVIMFAFTESKPAGDLTIQIETVAGRTVTSYTGFTGFDSNGIGRLLLPARYLKPGQYIMRLLEKRNGATAELSSYHFRVTG